MLIKFNYNLKNDDFFQLDIKEFIVINVFFDTFEF